MDQLISETLAALDSESDRDEQISIMRRAFNKARASDRLYDCAPFVADDKLPRFRARNAEGHGLMIPGQVPEVGTLVSYAGKDYYVESHLPIAGEPAPAKPTNPKSSDGRNQAAR